MDTPFDLVFENAQLVDGTGAPYRMADVAVNGDRIACVASPIPSKLKRSAGQRFDVMGRILCPGFIDVHAHGELEPFVDTSAAGKVSGGVTSEISGNCGCSPFPLFGALRPRWEREARDVFGWGPEHLNWTSVAQYLERLEETGCAINRGFLLGHGSLRAAVSGYEDVPLDDTQKKQMVDELEAALDAGVFGLSSGLIYPPGCYALPEELLVLAAVCADRGALYTTHMRSEGDALLEAVQETLQIAAATGVRTQISHLKVQGERNWPKIDALEETLMSARKEGLDFHADRYPYIASSTSLDSVLPRWVFEGGHEAELNRLKDHSIWERIDTALDARFRGKKFWEEVLVADVVNKALRDRIAGKTIYDLSLSWRVRPNEALRRVLIEDETRTSAIFFSMKEENLERILGWDFVMIGSDATARDIGGATKVAHPHPRTFGAFPRVLAKYVREKKCLTLENAIYRMTGLPAKVFGIEGRGMIEDGAYADLLIFDLGQIQDRATYEHPNQRSTGMLRVYVNGKLVVLDDKVLDVRPGRVLRHKAV